MEDIPKILNELEVFLQLGARSDLKIIALDTILSLTSQEENVQKILDNEKIPILLVSLIRDKNLDIPEISSRILINLSSYPAGSKKLLNLREIPDFPKLQILSNNLILECLSRIIQKNFVNSNGNFCKILANLTNIHGNANKCREFLDESGIKIDEIVQVFRENPKILEYLACFLGNLTQDIKFRTEILNKPEILRDLLPFSGYEDSDVVRGGILGLFRNLCFDTGKNSFLLGETVEILPFLLLPLAGNEEFDEEDNEKLPIELQYLPEEKLREPRAEFRKIILETLTQLCTEKTNREYLREKNSYVILREFHKWEKNEANLEICENLVNILIRTEDEIGCENLKNVEIPEEIVEKFEKI